MTAKKKPEDKEKAGAPSLYRVQYCDKLIEVMGNGKNFTCFCHEIGIVRDTAYGWTKQYPEFSDALKKGKAALENYMIDEGRLISRGVYQFAKPGIWVFMMKNMCGWTDKTEVKSEHTVKMKPYIIEKLDGSKLELGVETEIIEAEVID